MKIAWDLHDESIRSSSTNHYIYMKRAWYQDKEWMRSTWWKQGSYINEESMWSRRREHEIYMKRPYIYMNKAYNQHEESTGSTWQEH